MENYKLINWILRISVAGEFLGHGVFAVQGKAQWISWIQKLTGADVALAAKLLLAVGVMDIAFGLLILIKPVRPVLLWMAVWGFWTALVRPIVGDPIWDFIERFANWGAPLALFFLIRKTKK